MQQLCFSFYADNHYSPEQLAYLAAYVDADGSISISCHGRGPNSSTHTLLFTVTNTHKPTIDSILAVFGGHLRTRLCRTVEGHSLADVYEIRWRSDQAGPLLRQLIGELRTKKARANIALKFLSLSGRCPERRHELYLEMQACMASEKTYTDPEEPDHGKP